jgi:signal transduction histidine kinase
MNGPRRISFKYRDKGDGARGRGIAIDPVDGAAMARNAGMQAQQLLAGQNRALELIMSDAPLPEILEYIARFIEAQTTGLSCSVLLLSGSRLVHGAAPSIPSEYVEGIDNLEIGPAVGSCGTAAFTGKTVVVTDIATDPRWAIARDLALAHGLRACWSTPIFSADHAVLGTFAIYYPTPIGPRDGDQNLVQVASHLTGIAIERRRFEAEQRQRARDLIEANREKDDFIAMISHELRNPLAPILMATELIRSRKDDPASVERYRAVIDRQTRQLARLVDDLLDVSRGVQGKIVLAPEPATVAALIHRAVETAAPFYAERHHTLSVRLPAFPLDLLVDPVRMTQVLANVLNNAAKYTPPGGEVGISAEQEGQEIVIRVRDRGRGMAPEQLARVFEPFFQVPRRRDQPEGGLGLGLTLVRRLVELHGGVVEAHSEGLGRGTEVVIHLPATIPAKLL